MDSSGTRGSSLEKLPLTIEAAYSTPAVNDPVSLYEGQLELEQGGQVFTGAGVIEFQWLPRPGLAFRLEDYSPRAQVKLEDAVLRIPSKTEEIQATVTKSHLAIAPAALPLCASGAVQNTELGSADSAKTVVFHIPNFHAYLGSGIRGPDGSAWAGRASAEVEGWRVTIDGLYGSARELHDELKNRSGYGITHVGRVEKVDSKVFALADVKEFMQCLYWFLSFCRGAWVAPLLAVGFDVNGDRVWEQWHNWRVDRWRRVGSWFNTLKSEGLERCLPGFVERWRNDMWLDPMKTALYWYVHANTCAGGIEGSIILAQAAFELLSWTLLVEDRQVLSTRGFDKLPAMDRLRLLFSMFNAPLAIPTSLTQLTRVATSNSWQDAPQALTEIRNALVHPSRKKREKLASIGPDAEFDAWFLALWYLELALLWLFDYQGTYSNRLRRDVYKGQEVEPVPWAGTGESQ